jgi:hypothetical protein
MSRLDNDMQIKKDVVIPQKGILAPQDEFRMLGVFLRFTPSDSDPHVSHITSPSKWTLAFKAAEKLCNQVSNHLRFKKATIKQATILVQSVLVGSPTYRYQLGQLNNADLEHLERIVFG